MSRRDSLVQNNTSSENPLTQNRSGRSGWGKLRRTSRLSAPEKGLYVVGENKEVVKHLKVTLPKVSYGVLVVSQLKDAKCVLLVVESVEFKSENIKNAVKACKGENGKHLLVLYVSKTSRNVQPLLAKVTHEIEFIKKADWVPYLTSEEFKDYRHAAIMTILRGGGLYPTLNLNQRWKFFISHKQSTSQGPASDLYWQLQNLGYRAWWDVKMDDLTLSGMMNGIANSDYFVLILNKKTLDSNFVAKELEQAISLEKQIIVLYDEREQFGGADRKTLVEMLFNSCHFAHKYLLSDVHWISVDMYKSFSKAMVNRIMEACKLLSPNEDLNALLKPMEKLVSNMEDNIHLNARDFHPGTREWIFKKYDTWSSRSEGNKVFAVVGHAGIGKTTLSSELIVRGTGYTHGDIPQVVGFHLFDHRESDGAGSAKVAVLSICYQLRYAIPGFWEAVTSTFNSNEDITSWNLEHLINKLLIQPIKALSRRYEKSQPRHIIILDALDECSSGFEFYRAIRDKWVSSDVRSWLGLFITCRPEIIDFYDSESDANEHGVTMLKTDDESNKADVRIVLSYWLKDLVEEEQVITDIAELSQGVFLYLRFVHEALVKWKHKRNETGSDKLLTVSDVAKEFPSGLRGYYKRYFERLQKVVGNRDRYQMVLGAVLASRGPLPLELWMRCCGVEGELCDDGSCDEKFESIMEVCKSLMNIPSGLEHGQTSPGVSFIHKSIADYLSDKEARDSAWKWKERHLHVPGEGPGLKALLQQVENLFRDPDCKACTVSKEYSYRNMFAFLCKAKRFSDAYKMLYDLDSLLTWLAGSSSVEVVQEILQMLPRTWTREADVKVVLKLLRLGQAALVPRDIERKPGKQFPSQLPSQILGRLSEQGVEKRPNLRALRDAANRYYPGIPWLKPATSNLLSVMPGGMEQIIRGHSACVNSVAFNHDGTRIVSGSSDNTIRIWDAVTGQPIGEPLVGNSGSVNSVAFNHDGTRIVSSSGDNGARGSDSSTRIWDAVTGQPIHEWGGGYVWQTEKEINNVNHVAFNHDGTRFVSSDDEHVILTNAVTGQFIGHLYGHSDWVSSVAFNHDGTRIVSGSEDKTVRIWDALTRQPICGPLEGHSGNILSVAFNHDGTRIVSGSWDNTIRIWDAVTGQPIGEPLVGRSGPVQSVAFNHDGTRIVSGSWDKTVRIWDAVTGQLIGEPLVGHSSSVYSVAFNHDGTRIISGSGDSTIRIWDAVTGQLPRKQLNGHSDDILSVAFNHDGTRIVSGSRDSTIRIWDACTGQQIGEPLLSRSMWVNSVAFNHDGTRIVSGSLDKTIRIWDACTGRQIGEPLVGHSSQVHSVAFNYDGTRIVSSSGNFFTHTDITIRIWDADTGQPIGEPLVGHSSDVKSVAYNHDGTRIVSGSSYFRGTRAGEDNTIRVWDAVTGQPIGGQLNGPSSSVNFVAFNRSGTRIVSVSDDMAIRIWDAVTGQPIAELDRMPIDQLANFNTLPLSMKSSTIAFGEANCIGFTLDSGRPGNASRVNGKSLVCCASDGLNRLHILKLMNLN